MNMPHYDETSGNIRICNGDDLYDIYIDGIRLRGAYGPDVINSIIAGSDKHSWNVRKNLPEGLAWEEFKRRLREFRELPE